MCTAHHVKLLLEFLIGVVNTELLKAVDFKSLKPCGEEKCIKVPDKFLIDI